MANNARIRRLIYESIAKHSRPGFRDTQTVVILRDVQRELGGNPIYEDQQFMLEILHELFRNGTIAPGLDLVNPCLPHFHLTTRGRKALEDISRDPGNQDGYVAFLKSAGLSDSIALSYAEEAAHSYSNSCYKSAAVMAGCATERLVVLVRDELSDGLRRRQKSIPPKLADWRFKTIRDAIAMELDANLSAITPLRLQESYQSNWRPFTDQLRLYRNDAGHPTSVHPITAETAHANLLVFPEVVILVTNLVAWIRATYV